jgi:hypothetical protein
LAGEPNLQLRIDPPHARLTLRAPIDPVIELPINSLAHVTVDTLIEDEACYLEISTTDEDLALDGYAMLMAVADRIQFDDLEPLVAFEETLGSWEAILAARARLGTSAEVGLFGELLVVRSLLATGVADLAAWRGGFSEEHDFGFDKDDIEVKTTSGERREHWIHGLSQLTETHGNHLWALSIQITRSGADQGLTLPELIDETLAGASGTEQDLIEQNLAGAGWHSSQRDLYGTRWHLRAHPLLLRIDPAFPRLTPSLLSEGGIDIGPLRRVDYVIDLTDSEPSAEPPPPMAAILDHMISSSHV